MSRTVPLLNRFEDPATSSDPRVRSVVEKLGAVDYAPAVRPEFRDELRAQLVAIASRVVSEGDLSDGVVSESESRGPATLDPVAAAQAANTDNASTDNVTPLARPATSAPRRRSHASRVGRPLGLAAACCAVLALGLGGAVWKSRSALPGDSLYGLKRTSESVQLSLTSGKTARGHEYLKLASTRVQEAQDLLGQDSALASGSGIQASGLSPTTVSLIKSTLGSADTDVTSGAQLLLTASVTSHSPRPWSIMTRWAQGQVPELRHLASAIGPSSETAHNSTLHTLAVVRKALDQAGTQQQQPGSKSHTSPSTTAPTQHPGTASRHAHAHARSTAPTAHATHHHPSTHGSSSPTSGPTHHTKHHPAGASSSTPTSGVLPTKHSTKLPTKVPSPVPTLKPTVGVGVKSCGISVGIGPINVSVGSCPTGS